MRHGERGDDFQDVPECRLETLDGAPVPVRDDQHGGQQQREQEQDVVEADPDMPDALAAVVEELRQAIRLFQLEALLRGGRAEDRACA